MIRTLRAYFFSRLLREKILLVAFILIVALLWLSNLSGRLGRFRHNEYRTTLKLAEQKQWLSRRTVIADSARKAASIFDPSRTLDSTQLLAAVSAIAKDTGLKSTTSSSSPDISNDQFAVHTLVLNITKVEWPALETFYRALMRRAPYIGIEQIQLASDHANPGLLNATLRISSVEIVHGTP